MKIIKSNPDDVIKAVGAGISLYNSGTGQEMTNEAYKGNIKLITEYLLNNYGFIKINEIKAIFYKAVTREFGETYKMNLSLFCKFFDQYLELRKKYYASIKPAKQLKESPEKTCSLGDYIKEVGEREDLVDLKRIMGG